MSFQRTAIKYALQMEPSTAIPDAISGNAVPDAMILSLRPHQPHQNRLTPGFPATACHNHSTNTAISCTHDPRTKSCCPSFYTYSHAKGHPNAYTSLYTKCSTCATMKVRPCPHIPKMPDYRDVNEEVSAPGSTNDALDLECPWIMLAIVHLGAGH